MDLDRKTAYEVLMDIEKNQAYSNLALNQYVEKNIVRLLSGFSGC